MRTRLQWLVGLILGAFLATSTSWADVRLNHSVGNWSIGACATPHYGQFEFGDSISSSCSESDGGDSHSASIQESSSIVMGSHGVDSMTMSVTIGVQGNFDGASGSLDIRCGFEVTTPTPFTLSVQPSMGGQVEGRVKFDAGWNGGAWDGCECVGSDCAGYLGCEPGQGNLLLQGVLQPGMENFQAFVFVRLEQEQAVEAGSAHLTFSISFNRASTTYHWVNQSGGEFALNTNWNPQGVPTHDAQVSDIAIFEPGLYGVNAVGAKAGRFVIRQADVGLVGDAQVFGTTGAPASLEVEGDGSLQLNGGSVLRAVHGAVGIGAPANSSDFSAILMDDAATLLVLSGNLIVGQDMPGLVALDGGFLQAADVRLGGTARGELEVSGADADALFADVAVGGSQGIGRLNVLDGGTVTVTDVRIGGNKLQDAQTGETNTVHASGAGPGGSPAHLIVSDDLLVGADGFGDLFVLDGALVEAGGSVTIGLDSVGDVYVSSQDLTRPAILKAGPLLQIGENNAGRLTIEPGGRVEASNVRINFGSLLGGGELTIDGQGQSNAARMKVSQELGVGGDPQVTPIFVKNGGVLTARSAIIGNDALLTDDATVLVGTLGGGDTTPAEFNIVDPNSNQLTGGAGAIVGGAGPGRLNIAGGAIARLTGALRIGDQAEGAMSVDNSGSAAGLRSTAILSGIAAVGWDGAGELAISNGGLVTSDSDIVVAFSSFGEIRVFNGQGFAGDRAELRMLGSALEIGFGGSGELNVQGNGLVRCARLVVGGYDIAGAGDVLVDTGGEINCLADMLVGAVDVGAGSVTVGPAGTLVVDGVLTVGGTSEGLIALTDATSRVSAGILTGASTLVKNHGSIVGVGTLATASLMVEPGGFVSPGLSPGTLTIDGNYEQLPGSTLVIEIAGLEPGQFDVLRINGNAKLAGQVELRFIGAFTPQIGDAVEFLKVSGTIEGALTLVGSFADDSTVPAGAAWVLTPAGVRLAEPTGAAEPAFEAPPLPGCGAGSCGTGGLTALPMTLAGLVVLRRGVRSAKNGIRKNGLRG